MRQVTLGDKTYALEGFRAFKALRAGEIVSRITDDVPGILEEMAIYAKKAEEWNTVTVGRASAQAQYPHLVLGMSNEDWEAENNQVTLVVPVDREDQIVAVFPMIFKTAKDHVLELLALIIAPNSELRKADDIGDQEVMDTLDRYKKELLHEADLKELMDLAITTVQVIREEYSEKVRELGNLLRTLTSSEKKDDADGSEEKEPTPTATVTVTKPGTSSVSPPASSTATAASTSGAAPTASTESPGVNSSDSVD